MNAYPWFTPDHLKLVAEQKRVSDEQLQKKRLAAALSLLMDDLKYVLGNSLFSANESYLQLELRWREEYVSVWNELKQAFIIDATQIGFQHVIITIQRNNQDSDYVYILLQWK